MSKVINKINQETVIDNVTNVTLFGGGIIVEYMDKNITLPNETQDDTLYPQRTFINEDNYQFVEVID